MADTSELQSVRQEFLRRAQAASDESARKAWEAAAELLAVYLPQAEATGEVETIGD